MRSSTIISRRRGVSNSPRTRSARCRRRPALPRPARATPGSISASASAHRRRCKQLGGGIRLETWRDRDGDWSRTLTPELRFQVSTRLVGSVGTEYTSALDIAQWIKNLDTNGDKKDDQYVFGRLLRRVVSITGRTTYSFTRDMTLETHLQPFIAVGDYTNIGRLARAKTFEFTSIALDDDPDFNKKSVRGTIVLRWEYLRGSTLFAVWNLSTSDELARKGIFSPWQDLGGAFRAPGTNTFAFKLSYWFAP